MMHYRCSLKHQLVELSTLWKWRECCQLISLWKEEIAHFGKEIQITIVMNLVSQTRGPHFWKVTDNRGWRTYSITRSMVLISQKKFFFRLENGFLHFLRHFTFDRFFCKVDCSNFKLRNMILQNMILYIQTMMVLETVFQS